MIGCVCMAMDVIFFFLQISHNLLKLNFACFECLMHVFCNIIYCFRLRKSLRSNIISTFTLSSTSNSTSNCGVYALSVVVMEWQQFQFIIHMIINLSLCLPSSLSHSLTLSPSLTSPSLSLLLNSAQFSQTRASTHPFGPVLTHTGQYSPIRASTHTFKPVLTHSAHYSHTWAIVLTHTGQ